MRRLRNPEIVVPDGFRYVDRDTQTVLHAFDYFTWIERINLHRSSNHLPPITSDVAEDQLCQTLPPDWCEYEKEGGGWVSTRVLWTDVVTLTKALWASFRGNYVSQAEAERRAKICASCYLNVSVGGCGACTGLAGIVAQDRSTLVDRLLGSCAVCRCYNRSQIHFPLDILSAHATPVVQAKYPSFCWQRLDGDNYSRPEPEKAEQTVPG